MPRFTNGTTEISTSNAVEIVRLRASGYKPVATTKTDEPAADNQQPAGDDDTDQGKRTRARR